MPVSKPICARPVPGKVAIGARYLMNDLKFAFRQLLKNPGFTAENSRHRPFPRCVRTLGKTLETRRSRYRWLRNGNKNASER
jgi:hypothetical protein